MRIESVGLEDHGDVAVLGSHIVHHPVPDYDLTGGDFLQSCQEAQGGCFPAPGRSDQDKEFLVIDMKIHVIHCHHVTELFENVLVRYTGHLILQSKEYGDLIILSSIELA